MGALDIILDFDTKYFIDHALLQNNHVLEFSSASNKVEKYFEGTVSLISVSDNENDMYWRKAKMDFSE